MTSNIIDIKTGKPMRRLISTYKQGRVGVDRTEAIFGIEKRKIAPNERVWVHGLMPIELAYTLVGMCDDHNTSARG